MEPEPAVVPAEPVHEPEDNRDLMRHKLFTNLAAVGGLADLGELAAGLGARGRDGHRGHGDGAAASSHRADIFAAAS
jgi:hypothetical protein